MPENGAGKGKAFSVLGHVMLLVTAKTGENLILLSRGAQCVTYH